MNTLVTNAEPESSGWLQVGAEAPIPRESWGELPTLTRHQVRLLRRLARWSEPGQLPAKLSWLEEWLGKPFEIGFPEVLERPSGLMRAGLVAQLSLPEFGTRIGIGVETPLAHAVVDRLLGFNRPFAETRLQLSPVEWGIWTFLFTKILDELAGHDRSKNPKSPGPHDLITWPKLYLNRVGPDPFDPTALGKVTTLCWTSKLGPVTGTVRIWIPQPLLDRWLKSVDPEKPIDPGRISSLIHPSAGPSSTQGRTSAKPNPPPRELSSEWRARGGTVHLPRGLKGIRMGSVLPILRESSSHGVDDQISLTLDLDETEGRLHFSAKPAEELVGKRFIVTSTVRHDPPTREHPSVSGKLTPESPQARGSSSNPPQPPNLPVTLAVELGRVNLTLSRLADLKSGDIIELNRHTREPVELTSNGRLVARGELIKIDAELGVRITNVLL